MSGKTGPGAGRTSKLYRRADGETAVSLPEREYALAGAMMAEAIALSAQTGEPAASTLKQVAGAHGRDLASAAAEDLPRPHDRGSALENARSTLAGYGYEPRQVDDRLTLVNCPFHALAQEQTELVCRMNLALIEGVTATLDGDRLTCQLDPTSGRCCVVVTAR